MTPVIRTGAPPSAYAPWHAQLSFPDLCDMPLGPQQACEQLTETATEAAASVLDDITDALLDGFSTTLRMVITWWTDLPSPELAAAGGEPGPALAAIREYSGGLQVLLLTTGIMFAAARLALAKRGGLAGEAQESLLMLARAVFASMAFAAVITVGTRAGDGFANWVIFDASRGDWTGAVERLTAFDAQTRSGLGTGVLLLVGLLGVISTLIQLVMLVVRQALLIVVVAVIPLAAAASGTGPGSQAYKKLLSWSLAFVLYKPVGALVYAIAFTVIGNEAQQDPQLVLLGLILLVMSVVVLPALVRLVAPAVATLGAGGGSAAVVAGGAAGVAMSAVGERSQARKVSERENDPGGGGSTGSPSPPAGGSDGGGRPMPGSGGGGGGGSSPGSGRTTGGGGSSAGAGAGGTPVPPGGSAGSKSAATNAGAGAGGGAAAGAAGAGIAGAAVMGAQMIKGMAQQGVSAIDSQTRDATEGGLDPDSLGPGEVRR